MDLFTQSLKDIDQPLAEKLRPQKFSELIGQDLIFASHSNIFDRFKKGQLQSLILWGPPGCGKTSFASALINEVQCEIFQENAIDLGVKKIREIGETGKQNLIERGLKTLLFIDEIHRLNRGQQDVLLPYVERGYFYLVGATTENPSYHLNSALTSRARLLIFEGLKAEHLQKLADRAFSHLKIEPTAVLTTESFQLICEMCHGDARKLYNLIEELSLHANSNSKLPFPLNPEELKKLFVSSGLRFDKKGDEHYNVISAFIKSVRGSDPNAAIYYLARMLAGGEDPVFIARRLVILASEDIGNADPQALNLAVSGLQAVELIGMPEARISLAQVTTYLACAPKSNRSYLAINKALKTVNQTGPLDVPKHLRSSQTSLMKQIGYGENYLYSHDGDKGYIPQDYLPEELNETHFYEPSDRGFEKRMSEYQKWIKEQK